MSIANYTIQEWLFNEAHGKFDFDLGESGVQFQLLGDVEINPDWKMDYSQDRGSEALRTSIKCLYGDLNRDMDVMVTHGAQEALYLFYRSILNADDHVITIVPGWQQSWDVPKHIGCDVTKINWQPNSQFDIETLKNSITDATRVLIINSPCNPTGMSLTEDQWGSIVDLAQQHNLWVVNDEEYLLDFSQSIVHKYPRSLSVSSLSKVYGLPALRVGWAVSSKEAIEAMVNYKRYTTVSNSLVLENIAKTVLEAREKHIQRYQAYIDNGLAYLLGFAELARDKVELVKPDNTPFAWFILKDNQSSNELAKTLLAQHRLLVMPAEVFGTTGGFRVTYARSPELLQKGFNMILETLGIKERL